MKLSVMLNYSGDVMAAADEVIELEKPGLDCVWVAEANSFDGVINSKLGPPLLVQYGNAGTRSTAFYWYVPIAFTLLFLIGARLALGRRSQAAAR